MSRERDYTHCHDCGRKWTGRRECHCASCHNHFGSPSSFDRHFVAGRCMTAQELIDTDQLTPVSRKTGTVWVRERRAA